MYIAKAIQKEVSLYVERYKRNPIIVPKGNIKAVFNPGVVFMKDKVYLWAREIENYETYVSRIGLYISNDGINFKRVFTAIEPDTIYDKFGCEDPRAVKIGKYIYITYTALTTPARRPDPKVMLVRVKNPESKRSYRKIGIITNFSLDNKDVVLFPEKINGYYVMLHRPYRWSEKPSIWIAFSKDLLRWKYHRILLYPEYEWEELKVGAGAPPIKTKYGWILLYHGVDSRRRYSMGLAILDLKKPWKVIYKHPDPLWKPEKKYERVGDVPNVVFSTGAFIKNGKIWIYAGTADKYISLAFLNLDQIYQIFEK